MKAYELKYKYDRENEYMSKKLNTVKTLIKDNCPESFIYFQNRTFSRLTRKYFLLILEYHKLQEQKRQNEYLFNKLSNIYTSPPKKESVRHVLDENRFENNGLFCDTQKKWQLLKIIQDNHHFTKRLVDCKTSYPNSKNSTSMDFRKEKKSTSNKLKNLSSAKERNLNRSDINLAQEGDDVKAMTNEDFFKHKTLKTKSKRGSCLLGYGTFYSAGENKPEEIKERNKSNEASPMDSAIKLKTTMNMFNSKFELDPNVKKVLFKRKAFLPKLALVDIEFYIEKKK